jgi:hypothetical protein
MSPFIKKKILKWDENIVTALHLDGESIDAQYLMQTGARF